MAIGVKRLNRVPIIIIGVLTILVVGTLIYGLQVRQNRIKAERAKRQETSRDAVEMARALLSDVPDGVIEKTRRNEAPKVEVREVQVPERIPVPVAAEKSAVDKEREEERTRQRKLLEGALMAATRIEGGGESSAVPRQRDGHIDPNLGDFMKELKSAEESSRLRCSMANSLTSICRTGKNRFSRQNERPNICSTRERARYLLMSSRLEASSRP
jgi:hypothetical protein